MTPEDRRKKHPLPVVEPMPDEKIDALREYAAKWVATPAFTEASLDHTYHNYACLIARIDRLRAAAKALWSAYHLVHSAHDGECLHGFGPPATLCPNAGCPERDLAVAWSELLR